LEIPSERKGKSNKNKRFFFEKRNQKTFVLGAWALAAELPQARKILHAGRANAAAGAVIGRIADYGKLRHAARKTSKEPRLETPAPRRSLRPFIVLAVILSCIALACFAYYWLNRGYATTDDAQIDGSIYTISPQIAGRVAEIDVNDNEHVRAGQVLAVLDDRDAQIAVAKAEAGLTQAAAQLGVAVAQSAEAAAQLAETNANLQQAQQDNARFQRVNPHAVTQQQVDAAATAIAAAKAKSAAALANRDAMQASATAAQAALAAAQVALRNARLQRSYTILTAPAAGHISLKTAELGDVVAPGTAMMAVVGDPVWVTANYKETQLAGIQPGAQATIAVDAVPGIAFKAHVDSIQYGTGSVFSLLPAQNATGNYIKIVQRVPVKLVFDDARVEQYLLAPGMSVEPSIVVGK
jgi:membrane fusion protein (multidrug efflux system)